MKKLLLSLCLLAPCLTGAQNTVSCDRYVDNQMLDDGTHRYVSHKEITMPLDGDGLQRMGLYVEMGNYQHSFRIHLRTLRNVSYMGTARIMTFIFGDNTAIAYPLAIKRDNGEWIAEFANRAPETDLLTALRTRTLKAVQLSPAIAAPPGERHTVTIPERYTDSFMQAVNCIATMVR